MITSEDLIDVTIIKKKNKIVEFALNYRTQIKGKWVEVYRVDNFHGFLHEQKFWRSSNPIPLKEQLPLYHVIKLYIRQIYENFERYKKYFKEAR